jgi:Flp pilus assembly protein TadD
MSRRPKAAAKRRDRSAPTVNSWRPPYESLGLALVLLATFIVYLPAVNGEQLWDDDAHVTKPELRSLGGLVRIWFVPGATQQYYPLLHSAFWVEHRLWGDSVLGYHVLNVLLHMTSVTLLYLILKKLHIPGALLAAAIFALHPVMVESVAWISEQKNTLSAVFYLSALLVYLGFDESRLRSPYLCALGLFVLGLLTKTVTATLPAALLVIFWWQRGKLSWKRDVVPLLPFFVLGAVGGLVTAWIERKLIGAEGADFELTFVERGLLAGRVVWFYLSKLLWPANLIFTYPRWEIDPSVWWQWLFPAASLGVLIALWVLRRTARAPLAGWLLFVGTLVPVLGFLNVYPFIYSYVADHFQYLASIGMIVLAATGIVQVLKYLPLPARKAGAVVTVLFVATLAALTWSQSHMYADRVTLYQNTLNKNPDCWLAHNNLGSEWERAGNHEHAMEHYRAALRLRPSCAEAHSNLGFALTSVGRLPEAFEAHHAALALKPGHPLFLMNLSITLISAGRQQEAVEKLRAALEKNPDEPITRNTLGFALTHLGHYSEAKEHIERALKILPEYAEAHFNLGAVLAYTGQMPQAISQFQQGLKVNPNSANAHNNLGLLLMGTGETDDAIDHFAAAVGLKPDRADIHNNLGDALRQAGRFQEALNQYNSAVKLQPDYIQAYGNVAQTLATLNRANEAITTAEKAIEVARSSGQDAQVKDIEGWLGRFRLGLQQGPKAN